MKKAFDMFDRDGNGSINRQEFSLALNSLDIGLHYDEIDDLTRSISTQADGSISYDNFIMHMDANIRHRRSELKPDVEEAVFQKLHQCLQYAGDSLYNILKRADFEDTDSILREDLIRILKRIGFSSVEPHLALIF